MKASVRGAIGVMGAIAALALSVAANAQAAQDPGGGADIVGGQPTTIEQWPWQIALERPPDGVNSTFLRQFCGGSLISPTTVLTAAHCVFDDDPGVLAFQQPTDFSVLTGRTNLGGDTSGAGETAVTDVVYFAYEGGTAVPQSVTQPPVGPQLYNPESNVWDVAIVELATPAPAPAQAIPIAAPSERSLWDAGDTVYATGWGNLNSTPPASFPDDLRSVALQVISDSDCGDALSYGDGFDPATMVCAGTPPAGGKDTCQGDSGGPLVAPAGDGTYRLIGDTSFGVGCAQPEKWGVYGRVADSTMRQAIEWGIQITPGGPGTPVLDAKAPKTKLKKSPKKKTTKRKAKFTFSASEPATFTCALDKAAAKPCSSPYSKRVSLGKHRLAITATDTVGNSSAATTYKWKVVKKKRKR
ncbi:MAG: serine protease [Solirubrobacterales bacterium]|nr:serine protease [Solirubrobacterales bacterium]MCB8971873.1 serine protease [Thermoleophilales bacterium]MCO5326322.1 serine protease [Solirubrobacterales bacterium]